MAISSTGHDDLREQAELYVLGALPPSERVRFEAHLATCAECAANVQSLFVVANALAQAVPQHEPSASLRARVLASIGPAWGTAVASPSGTARRTTSLAPWLAAAASLAVAVALGAYSARLRDRIGALESRLAQASERADLGEHQIADLRRASAEAQAQMAVLAAPDLQRIDLAGQPVAPQSSGRAFWSRSRGLVFTASNVPALPAGRTYQLWVLTAQPAPISAGLFRPDSAGRVSAAFNTPVDLPQPVGMAVTLEPEGGVAAPTGDKFLISS